MQRYSRDGVVTLETELPIWERFFTVAPLVLIGSREMCGSYDLAPKHMAFPLGWDNHFGFVCTPRHRTYQNIQREGEFTVSYMRPAQLVLTALAATPRCGEKDNEKLSLAALPTFPATKVNGVFACDAYVFLECALERVVDGFGENSLLAGRIVAAHVHQDVLRASERDDQEIIHDAPLMAYIYPDRFTSIDRTYSFPFPAGFKR
jgi:flavin reductase (DIM6/NTAB) family NADH-FMN oxidoreductase RutF